MEYFTILDLIFKLNFVFNTAVRMPAVPQTPHLSAIGPEEEKISGDTSTINHRSIILSLMRYIHY